MRSLSNRNIRELVTKAFVLEALTDKPGCTTRYQDLVGKPLQDFVIAGINSSSVFSLFADARKKDPAGPLFSHNVIALQASNKHKSAKFINFGLLEIMFPVVAARLKTNDPTRVIDIVVELIKNTKKEDVRSLLATRKLAWATSQTPQKIKFKPDKYKDLGTVWDFYMVINRNFTPESSNFQWTEQYKKRLPILRAFFDGYNEKGNVMKATKNIFDEQKLNNPDVAVGIIADMCAAAIFLWLSFNESPV